jgi:hypothetical protein
MEEQSTLFRFFKFPASTHVHYLARVASQRTMMSSNNDDRKQSRLPRRRRPGVVQGITNWWMKRQRFYVVQDNSIEDDAPIVDMTMDEDSFEVELQLSSGRPNPRSRSILDDDDDEDGDFSTMVSPYSQTAPPPPPSVSSSIMSYQPPLPVTNSSVPSAVAPPGQLTPTRSFLTAASRLAPGRQATVSAPALNQPARFGRSRTKDSFQGSLESIDSLLESCWDPEDDASLATPIVTNVARPIDFYEHVHFLRVQTQPRKVEVVWAKTATTTTAISPTTPRTPSSS